MDAIERLLAIENIKQLKARYFRCMDTKDWTGLEEVFTEDVVADMRGETGDESGLVTGSRNFTQSIRSSVEALTTVHHGHMPEIEILSLNTARGIWAMEDKLRKISGQESILPFEGLHGYGHYHETYERIDNQWRIKTIKLIRLRVDMDCTRTL